MTKFYLMKISKFVFFGLIFLACSEETLEETTKESIVVTAFLYEGQPIEDIQLTKTLPLGSEDTIGTPISNAIVSILKNEKSYDLVNNIDNPGYYRYSENNLLINQGDYILLKIIYDGELISGETIVPIKPLNVSITKEELLLEEVEFSGFGGGNNFDEDSASILVTWDNSDSTLYYVVVEIIEDEPVSIYSDLPFARAQRFVSSPARTSEYSINRRTVTHYGEHQAIVYKVNQEYANLYDSRNQDSRNLNEPLSNIENGLGVFSAFASDTSFFKVIKN